MTQSINADMRRSMSSKIGHGHQTYTVDPCHYDSNMNIATKNTICVTSRSGALTNLFFEDTCSQVIWIFMMIKHLSLMMMRHDRWHDVLLIWYKQVLLTQFYWVCRVFDLKDAEASMEPLDSGLSQGAYYLSWFIYHDIYWFDYMLLTCSDMIVDDASWR